MQAYLCVAALIASASVLESVEAADYRISNNTYNLGNTTQKGPEDDDDSHWIWIWTVLVLVTVMVLVALSQKAFLRRIWKKKSKPDADIEPTEDESKTHKPVATEESIETGETSATEPATQSATVSSVDESIETSSLLP